MNSIENTLGVILEYMPTGNLFLVGINYFVWVWGGVILILNAFLFVRSSERLLWLSFFDQYARKIRNILIFQKNHPGHDVYRSYIPEGELAEVEFYDEFSKHLAKANTTIYNCGDGFNMISPIEPSGGPSSRDKADKLDEAIIQAMTENPNLVYTRFQILSACNINWISRLIYLKEQFGEQFRVYTNRDYDHMGCFCAIDPKSDNCVFQWQLVSGRHYTRGTISKGFGFIYDNKNICSVVEQMFDDIKNAPATNQLRVDPIKRDIDSGLSIERLKGLQKELWDKRVGRVYNNPGYNIGDPEIVKAFEDRGVNRRKFKLSDMEFYPADFPVVSYVKNIA